jgi:hypothetical protein
VRRVAWVLALTVGLLSACGGGGGGGSSGPSFSVSYNRNAVSFDSFEGTIGTPQVIIGTGTGDPGGTVYAGVLIEGAGIAPSGVQLTFSGSTVTIVVAPRTDLPPGTYSGRLILQACADPQCTRHFSGSPYAVSYSSVVRTKLRLTPSSVALSAPAGESRRTRIAVTPTDGAATFSASVTGGSDWLRIENRDSTGFDVVTAPLPGGIYNGSVSVTSGAFTQNLSVPFSVTPAAGGDRDIDLGSSTSRVINVAATGAAQQTFSVTPPTWSNEIATSISYTTGSGWLSVVRGAGNTWTLNANALTLPPGSYAAIVTFAAAWPSAPRQMNVTLVVGSGLVVSSRHSLTVNAETKAEQLAGSIPVAVAGGLPFNWTASTASPWLQIATATGSSSMPINWTISQSALANLANFADHTATINVTTSLPNVPVGQVQVTLTRQLAELHQATPYLLVQGKSERLIVRGRGFDSMLNPASRLSIGGVTPTSVSRINDRQLVVQLPPVASPSFSAQATNALGIPTGTVTLKSVAPVARPYAFVPGLGGTVKSLIHDGERDALFATQSMSAGSNAVKRLVRSGATWTATAFATADVYDIALSPDGSALVMAMRRAELRWLDPVSGNEDTAARLVLPNRYLSDDREFFLAQGLTATADGLVWLATEPDFVSPWKSLMAVNLRTKEIVGPYTEQNRAFTFYRGPLFAAPRDGSRMLGRQNSGISGSTGTDDAVRYDAASATFDRSAKLRAPFDMRFTHDGRLVLVDLARVLDANDDLHGLVRLPQSVGPEWQEVAGQISGDGTRVYLLALPYRSVSGFSAVASGIKPRLFVFDASAASANPSGLPLLGYVELNDYPSDCVGYSLCRSGLASTISADGNTLFFLGDRGLVVLPVPTALQPVSSVRPKSLAPVPWRPQR